MRLVFLIALLAFSGQAYTKGQVFYLKSSWDHDIVCAYGFAYINKFGGIAPIFDSSKKPMTCKKWVNLYVKRK